MSSACFQAINPMSLGTESKPAFANLHLESASFNSKAFLTNPGNGKKLRMYRKNEVVFCQGDPANTVFYIKKGTVKLSVLSLAGKEAITALLGAGDFLGEGCLLSHTQRKATASALEMSLIVRLEKSVMAAVLAAEPEFSSMFLSYLLSRNKRIEEDLVDQLFNSAEKRLARTLLLLADYGNEKQTETITPKISQQVLAEMIGTTRSRVSFFMNKFRRLGYIQYNPGLKVHSSLLKIILHD